MKYPITEERKSFRVKKLFLCHYNGDAVEIKLLAKELRLRGIIPWVDKQGGFFLGDSTPEAARRAIREECFGLLFFATPQAFERSFITNVELSEAIQTREQNPEFILVAVPRGMDFKELSEKSTKILGADLGVYHTQRIRDEDSAEKGLLVNQFRDLSNLVLRQYLRNYSKYHTGEIFNFQFSTRELLPCNEDDVLCINATSVEEVIANADTQSKWEKIATGLRDIKTVVAEYFGRPRLRVHGSKHLTAAFLFGRIFSRPSGFKIDIRQRDSFWASDYPDNGEEPLIVLESDGLVTSNALFVEINATGKSVSSSVREYIRISGELPHRFISFTLADNKSTTVHVDNQLCVSMARQIRDNLVHVLRQFPIKEIHVFSSIPQGLAVLIGHNMNAFPVIQLYEFDGNIYHPSYRIENPM